VRLPAGELEDLIVRKLRNHLQDEMPEEAQELKLTLIRLVKKIVVHADRLVIQLKDGECLSDNYRFSAAGRYRQLVTDTQPVAVSENQKQTLLRAFLQGYIWRKQLFEGKVPSTSVIAKAENKNERYVARLISFSMVAPDLVARILKGSIPAHVNAQNFTFDLPISWTEQKQCFK
jgi:hypothetical protein